MNVLKVDPREWKKDSGETVVTYWVSLEGRENVPCYDARAQDLKVGEALPDGWTIAQSKAGKDYLKPPAKQGSTKREYVPRYTDTEAGWRANDERVDRRTALTQAVAVGSGVTTQLAEKFYSWLRETVPDPGTKGPTGDAGNTGGRATRLPGAGTSSGSSQVSARGESDSTSAPRAVVRLDDGLPSAEGEREAGPRGRPRVGADTSLGGGGRTTTMIAATLATGDSSTDGSTEGVGPIGGNEDRGQPPADMGKVHGGPCLHLKGAFEKRMANGDTVRFCLDCKQKLEVVKT